MKKYKLKEHVTQSMLDKCGFISYKGYSMRFGDFQGNDVYAYFKKVKVGYKTLQKGTVTLSIDVIEDVRPYIQDLIELDYVDEVK